MKLMYVLLILSLPTISLFAQTPEEKLKTLGIELPETPKPVANYVPYRQVGNLLYISGWGTNIFGKLGKDLSIEEGYEAARQSGIEIVSILKTACGDLSRIKQFVKVHGMVNCTADFYDQPKVMNGFSDLMVEVFGDKGKHTRAAVGQVSLPSNIAVEIAIVVELED